MSSELPQHPELTPELLRDFFDTIGVAREADLLEDPVAREEFKVKILRAKMEANPNLRAFFEATLRFASETPDEQKAAIMESFNDTRWGRRLSLLVDREDLTANDKVRLLNEVDHQESVHPSSSTQPWYKRLRLPRIFT